MKYFLLTHLYPHLRSFVFFSFTVFFFLLVCTNELPSLSFAPLQKRNQVVPVEYPHWNCFQLININIQLFLQLYGVPLIMLQWTIGSWDGGERGPEGVLVTGNGEKTFKEKKNTNQGLGGKKGRVPRIDWRSRNALKKTTNERDYTPKKT